MKTLTSVINGERVAIFYGVDWGGKDFNAMSCARCNAPYRWRHRAPKCCWKCGIKFRYTASEQPAALERGG